MDLELEGQHVLITGGSRGIGYACAAEFLAEGASVSLVGRDPARLREACANLGRVDRVRGFDADLTDAAAARAVIDAAQRVGGPIEILINAAGAARQKPFAELETGDWHDAMNAKFHTYMNVLNPLVKQMGARGRGAVVNIVGMGGKIPLTTHLPGGAANAALMLASAGLAMAYAPRGVRVNVLNPAKTATDRLAEGLHAQARERALTGGPARADIGIGRPATPREVATAVVFLASPRASYLSGAIIGMDGATRPIVV